MSKPLPGQHRLTIETIAQSAKTWLKCRQTTADHVVAYYRDLYELTPYRVRQLRKLLAT